MRKSLLQFLLIFAIATSMVWGQATSGTLSGKVMTAAGAGAPNAAVTITNVDTGVSQRVLTGPDGSFSAAGLPPGTYRMEVETAGFKRMTVREIQLAPPYPATINVTLVPGDIMETVEILGTAPVIQTDNGEVSLGIPTRSVRELPILDRNFQQLAQLTPGVITPTDTIPVSVDPERNRYFSTNGQRPAYNMWHMDGVNNWEPFRGNAIRIQPVESIQQMNLTTATPNAEKGFAAGLIDYNMTRPGANEWHGSLFEFHSNNDLRSRPFFNGEPFDKPRFTYNQFGGTAGGRIIADRTFFFGSYEGSFNRGRNSVLATVPTAEMRAGNFSNVPGAQIFDPNTGDPQTGIGRQPFTGNVIPSGRINPVSRALAAQIPNPNLPGFVNNFQFNAYRTDDWQKADGRIDHRFADHTNLFLRYGFTNAHALDEGVLGSLTGDVRSRVIAQNAIVNVTNVISPSFISEARLAYNRYDQKVNQQLTNNGFIGTVLGPPFGASTGLQFVNIPGLPAFGNPINFPMEGVTNNYNIVWIGSYRSSIHNWKFGTDIRQFRTDGFFNNVAFGPAGGATFTPGASLSPTAGGFGELGAFPNSFAAFLAGTPGSTSAVQFTETPTIRQRWYGFHASDTLQFARRLTLDLGVRYDLYQPIEPRQEGGAMFFNPSTNLLTFAGIGDTPMRGTQRDWKYTNIAPRISFAWQPMDKAVLRGGVAYTTFQPPYQFTGWMPSAILAGEGTNGGFGFVPGGFNPRPLPSAFAGGYPESIVAPNVPLNVMANDTETPYVQNWSIQGQYEFMQGMMGSVGYVGVFGRHLPLVQELNAGVPGSGIAGLPLTSRLRPAEHTVAPPPTGRTASTLLYTTGDNSNYNSLQAMLTKRFSKGLSFQGAYTYSHADGYTFGNQGFLVNPFDRKANYGALEWDRRNMLTLAHLWELPFGAGTNRWQNGWLGYVLGNWQLNGIFTWASGPPLTVTADPLFAGAPNSILFANPVGPIGVGDGTFQGQFELPEPGSLGSRGDFRGQGFRNYDMSVFKTFPVMDRYRLEVRGEVYNISNTPRFVLPVTHIGRAGFGSQPSLNSGFGRQFNVAARLVF